MSYETWYQNNRFHKDRRKKCLEDWARERWSWLLRAVTEISQAQQSHAGHQLSRDEALRQKFKCEMLRQRVCLCILSLNTDNKTFIPKTSVGGFYCGDCYIISLYHEII